MTKSKCRKRAIVILCAAALLFILVGCKKQAPVQDIEEETTGEPTEPLEVELGAGIGPVKFGMPKEEVIKNFGGPDTIEGKGISLNYISSKGLVFLVSPDHGVRSIDCWTKEAAPPGFEVSDFAGSTKKGIAMGASREQIVAAYGQPDHVTTQGPMTMLHYNRLRALFTLKGKRLVKFSTSAPR